MYLQSENDSMLVIYWKVGFAEAHPNFPGSQNG